MHDTDALGSYTRVGNNYLSWIHTADQLFAASAILGREARRARHSLRRGAKPPLELLTNWTQLMVAGFGIECLIKAVWLKNGCELIRDGKYVPIGNEGHRFASLCDHVGIRLTPRERSSLQRLSLITRSIGRYPILRSAKEAKRISWGNNDDDVIESFAARLKVNLSGRTAGSR